MWFRRPSASALPVDSPPRLADYERSPLRWHYDAVIAEFNALRAEIILKEEQIERTYAYLVTLLGVILASQVVSHSVTHYLIMHPSLYLIAALLSFWFPANVLCLIVDTTTLGTYIRDVLGPKAANLAAAAVADATASGRDADALAGWGDNLGRTLPAPQRQAIRGLPFGWEEFLPLHRFGGMAQRATLAPIYMLRSAFLYSAPVVLIVLFFVADRPITGGQICLIVAIAVVIAAFAMANLGAASFIVYGLRRGPFKVRSTTVTSDDPAANSSQAQPSAKKKTNVEVPRSG